MCINLIYVQIQLAQNLVVANRIIFFSFIFLISSSLVLSPILSSHAFYNQKSRNLASAQIDNSGNQPSTSFSLPPNLASAQIDNSGNQPSTSFSFPLFPNVAFAQTAESESQPSDSFSLTVSSICEGDPGDIVGTDLGETLSGGAGADTILGCGGDDTLNGNGGNDIIDGGEGADQIHGNEGDDTLTGGPGADTFFCGEGFDTITDFNPNEDDINGAIKTCENIVEFIPPTLVGPEGTVTCEDGNFQVSGDFAGSGASIIVSVDGIQIGTATADENGHWETTIDPKNENLGDGEHTLIATVNGADNTNEITVTIDCPALPTTIDDPAAGTTIGCDQPLTVSGTFDSNVFNSVELFVDGNSVGFADLNGDNWSITVPAEVLGEGSHTLVAEASTGGSEPFTSESDPITVTAECPPPGGGGGGGAGGGGGGGAGGGGGGGAGGIAVTVVDRQIFQRPYTELDCTQSVVELKKELVPTTPDFPAVVDEVKSRYKVTVLNVYNAPDYKAMLLADGDEKKLNQDNRFVLAPALCGELILEVDLSNEANKPLVENKTTMNQFSDQIVAEYHVKVIDTIDMPDYKALVILAEPTNPVTKDPRFINYGEGYKLSSNYTGEGELNLRAGHIAAPAPVLKEETIPDSIKRTFTTKDLKGNSNFSKNGVDVDIAVLDTGIDLKHPDLNVYKNVSFIPGVKTGDDDNGHGSHVAGIAAAKDNGKGVIGAAPGARLWSVKVCDKAGECKISDMIKGVEYITQHADEIDVVNISVETPLSPALNRAISASVKAGVTYVVAAGNYGHDANSTSPASDPDAITVSAIADSDGKCGGTGPALKAQNATATDDSFAHFSNFGPSVSIAAPGVDILSTYLKGGYAIDSGTSMASPSVSGAAALIKAGNPEMSPQDVKKALLETGSTPLTPCKGGPQGYFTGDPDQYKEPLLYRKLGGK